VRRARRLTAGTTRAGSGGVASRAGILKGVLQGDVFFGERGGVRWRYRDMLGADGGRTTSRDGRLLGGRTMERVLEDS